MASDDGSTRPARTRRVLVASSVIALVIAATVAVAFSTHQSSVQEVTVPSVISLPATEVQDVMKNVDLVAQSKLLGWKSTAPPWGAIASQSPRAGTLVAVGTHVQVGFYLGSPGGVDPSRWPSVVPGRLHVQGSYANPARIGALITKADLQFGPISSKSLVGTDGYGLATIDGFVYPASTTDAGSTWRVAGLWFAGPWADGAAFPDTIRTYSHDVAVAFYSGEGVFYMTADGGTTWFASSFPGNVIRVSGRASSDVPASSVTVTISNSYGAKRTAIYRTVDSGRHWSLIGQAGVSGVAPVPNLSGMTIAQASSSLVAQGFVPSVDHLWIAGDSPQVVVSQMPSPGAVAQRGADVAIAVPH